VPSADVSYACDYRWWKQNQGLMEFQGLKLCMDNHPDLKAWGIRNIIVDKSQDNLLVGDLGVVGWGGNSGFHALNLAVQFGCKKILLIGFDMRVDRGIHWHGPHKGALNNPTPGNVGRWRRVIDNSAPALAALDIEVINCSDISVLRNYPKMSFERALEC